MMVVKKNTGSFHINFFFSLACVYMCARLLLIFHWKEYIIRFSVAFFCSACLFKSHFSFISHHFLCFGSANYIIFFFTAGNKKISLNLSVLWKMDGPRDRVRDRGIRRRNKKIYIRQKYKNACIFRPALFYQYERQLFFLHSAFLVDRKHTLASEPKKKECISSTHTHAMHAYMKICSRIIFVLCELVLFDDRIFVCAMWIVCA